MSDIDWSRPDAMEQWEAKVAAARARAVAIGKTALEEAIEAVNEAAPRAFNDQAERRAQEYAKRPYLLDKHFPNVGLRACSATAFLARIDALIEQAERGVRPRWYGMGGESPMISLRAARLFGERQLQMEAA